MKRGLDYYIIAKKYKKKNHQNEKEKLKTVKLSNFIHRLNFFSNGDFFTLFLSFFYYRYYYYYNLGDQRIFGSLVNEKI